MNAQPQISTPVTQLSYDAAKALGRHILQLWGDPSEDNDRIATLEVRPGMAEGGYQALAVRCWGNGNWCRADGEASYCTTREMAAVIAERWVEKGRMGR